MRLKKLEITGFKSFADRTKIEFAPGITAIVGPNGCGKSNIADAFRWVLGEQSAKSMRGTKMPDVIFAGTKNRKPLNFAEVTITLSDVEGKLPIDEEEIVLTRKLQKNGESEYFINRHPVRLKDLTSLLLDSRIGKDAYTIFEQGKIDQVINLPPIDRRYIFEEASGILRFLQRKKEALRKLEQADQNVNRVKDITGEVYNQIKVLEEQAEKARKYKECKEALEHLEKSVLLARWEIQQRRLDDLSEKAKIQDSNVSLANQEIDALQMEAGQIKVLLSELDQQLKETQEEVFSMRSAKEMRFKERQNHEERLKDLSLKEKRWQSELHALNLKKGEREKERQALQNAHAETSKRLKEAETHVRVQQRQTKSQEDELAQLRFSAGAEQTKMVQLLQAESQCEVQVRQLHVRLEAAQEKQEVAKAQKAHLSKMGQDLQCLIKEKENELESAVSIVEQQKSKFAKMEEQFLSFVGETEKTENQLDELNQSIGETSARFKVLQRLKEEMEGFSSGAKKLIQAALDKKSPLFKKIKGLYEYIIPLKGAEEAIAAVMKPYAQTLVVETAADLDAVLSFAKQHEIIDISLVCLETVADEGTGEENKSGTLKKGRAFSRIEPLEKKVADNLLSRHFLRGSYTVKETLKLLEYVTDYTGLNVWIGDGAFVDAKSVVFSTSQGESNAFLREAEIKQLDKKLERLEKEKEQIERVLNAIQQKREILQGERQELDKTIRQSEMKIVEINFTLQKAIADFEKTKEENKALENEWRIASDLISTLSGSLKELNLAYAESKEKASQAKRQVDLINLQIEKSSSALQIQSKDLKEKENAWQRIVEEHRLQIHAEHVLEVKDFEALSQEKRLKEEIDLGRSSQKQIEIKKTEMESLLHEAEHGLLEVTSARKELEQKIGLRKGAFDHFEIKINDKRRTLKKLENDHHSIKLQAAQAESNAEMLAKEMQARFELNMDLAKSQCTSLDRNLEQAEKEMKRLKAEIESAGDVNMTSIEDCSKHKARHQFLSQQIDDLDCSKNELIAIIESLDEESRRLLSDTFVRVRSNFQKNFSILFNGGEADLQLTESSDILEAGIDIIAKPPGKQMGSINLLSGGEKCLAAIALLFAVFEVKPAPFCILDEIDAPLDDANIERFVNIVKIFSHLCQFIIITHNKRTMAIADVICGVSMEEMGISKILRLNFSKNAEPAIAAV